MYRRASFFCRLRSLVGDGMLFCHCMWGTKSESGRGQRSALLSSHLCCVGKWASTAEIHVYGLL